MDFEIVINEAENSHEREGRERAKDIKITGDRPDNACRRCRKENHQAAHGRRADFGGAVEHRNALVFALLAKINRAQFFDQPWAKDEA